ncbi:MAG: bifunctional phosphoribosylaminoimidazolecarboxamide formyltransferase/IMP cyclohydrolase [Parvibaculaceae bacterium]
MSPPVRRALLSVSDKTGLIDLARALSGRGIELVSTGGTARALKAEGLSVTDVSAVTGFPEIMDGRVKTLHPRIHGGLLGDRGNADHMRALDAQAIAPFELLVVNLYPFEAVTAKGAAFDEAIENIDIGGPAMIRAAAKNHSSLAVIVDPADYEEVLAELDAHRGAVGEAARRRFAAKAFARTAAYDAAIAQWFACRLRDEAPAYAVLGGRLVQRLRYGENPHQSAAFYRSAELREGVATAEQLQGKELSYNNINDTDAAFECVAEFAADKPACAIVKHANPCGVALGGSLADAYRRALACDPVSAFGGIIAFNRPIDAETAEEVVKIFTEVIIAPGAGAAARKIIAEKKNLRLLVTQGLPDPRAPGIQVKTVAGGFLLQSRDGGHAGPHDLKVVTRRAPASHELADLQFAFTVAKHVKSNAIVYAKQGATVGIGAGQMSRVDSTRIAAAKSAEAARASGRAEPLAKGAVVASDAFFPFADGLVTAAEAGVTAVIQPGGSLRDGEVIAAADALGLAMVFTGRRHFRH